MNFASDNVYGVHPRILAAINDINAGTHPSYGFDNLTRKAEEKLSETFGREVRAFLVTTGTAANGLALAAITPPYGGIITNTEAHVFNDECAAPEFFTGGAKLFGINGVSGKITPSLIERTLKGFIRGEHDPKPAAVSITNATELGTVYSPGEIKAISDLIKPRGMRLHMDGARFANAVAGLGCTPAGLSWKAGVDVMSFGATKNGAMLLEAVVFFDEKLAEDFPYRRMRAGQLVSKSRYLGAQMLAYLESDLWLDNARRANALAQRLAKGLAESRAVRIAMPVEANIIFAVLKRRLHDRLHAGGAIYHQPLPGEIAWFQPAPGEFVDRIAADETIVRFIVSFTTAEADIDRFLDLLAKSGSAA